MNKLLNLNDTILIKRAKKIPNLPSTLPCTVSFLDLASFNNGDDWVGVRLTGHLIGHGSNNGCMYRVHYVDGYGHKSGFFLAGH